MRQPGEAPGERGELPRRRRSNEDADSVEAMVDSSEDEQNTLRENEAERLRHRKRFQRSMRSVLAEGTSLKSVAGHILASIGELHTKYGRFRKALEKGTMAQSSPVGRDLLPVSLDGGGASCRVQ